MTINYLWTKKAVFYCIIFLVVISCKPDTKSPNWNVDVLTPILHSRVDIQDLVEDSLLASNSENELSLIHRTKLAEFNFERITEGLNKTFENTANLQNINLGTQRINNNISLGQLSASAGGAGAVIAQNNGNTAAIPAFTGIGPQNFPMDASNLFQTMTLSDGWLVIKIYNGLPIELTNIQYSMQNLSGGTPIISKTVASIPPDSTYADSVQLNNNIVIDGQLIAALQNMDTPGSEGVPVLIDTTDAINIDIVVKDLVPVSATAIFPDQILIEDTADTEIEDFNGDLVSMHVGEGKLFLDATSTIEDEIVFTYSIPSAISNGTSLVFTENVPAAVVGGVSNHYAEKTLIGYDVDLTGRPGSNNIFNTFFTITDGRIDSSGNLISLSLTDSVFLKTGIINLVASRGYGYLGNDTLQSEEESEVDIFRDIEGGELDFDEVKIWVEINNYIGAPVDAVIKSLQSSLDGQTVEDLTWSSLNQSLTIPAATENTPGSKPTPGTLTVELNKANSNIDELMEIQPDLVKTEIEGYLNRSVPTADYNQFLYADYGMDVFISTEVPLHLSAENLLFRDTSIFRYEDLDPSNRLQSGSLILTGNNSFPFDLNIDLILLDSDSIAIDTLFSSDVISAGITTNGIVTEEVKSTAKFPLTIEVVEHLKSSAWIVTESTFNTASLPEKVKLLSDSHLDITISGDVVLSTKN